MTLGSTAGSRRRTPHRPRRHARAKRVAAPRACRRYSTRRLVRLSQAKAISPLWNPSLRRNPKSRSRGRGRSVVVVIIIIIIIAAARLRRKLERRLRHIGPYGSASHDQARHVVARIGSHVHVCKPRVGGRSIWGGGFRKLARESGWLAGYPGRFTPVRVDDDDHVQPQDITRRRKGRRKRQRGRGLH